MHQEGMRHLFRDPIGPVGMYIDAKARHVHSQAVINASGAGPGPKVRSTRLVGSIRYPGLEYDSDGLVAFIGTDVFSPRQHFPYPLAMELGMPSRAGPLPAHQFSQRTIEDAAREGELGKLGYGPFPYLRPALESAFLGV